MDVRFKVPSNFYISGQSQCGKSYLVCRLLYHLNELFHPVPSKVIYCYGEYQKEFDDLRGVDFIEGFPQDLNELTQGHDQTLLVLDDLMSECSKVNDTVKAEDSMSVFTDAGGVDTLEQIKGLNSVGLAVNGTRYWYFLAKIRADRINRTETTVQFNFVSTHLKNGKMALEIYEGYIFDNFSDSDYTSANLTTHTPYPHQKDFDKHKFRDAMTGDVLLAGTEQNDGTVIANDQLKLTDAHLGKEVMTRDVFLAGTKQNDGTVLANGDLRLTGVNLRGAIPFQMTPILPYNGLSTNTWSVVLNDSTIPTSNFTLQYRLIAYKESNAGLSRDYHLHTNISYTNDDGVRPVIKRSGRAFYLNRELTYNPPSDCFGYSLEFKQIKPTTSLGNESILTCLLTQVT